MDTTDIERFVRGTLGCGCPDEVFGSVAVGSLPAAAGRPPRLQLLVGSRLLIHVVAAPTGAAANGWLEALVADGRATRDRHGYKRFRLVVTEPVNGTARPEIDGLAARFARATVGDDRAHLHVLRVDQLPPGFDPSATVAK